MTSMCICKMYAQVNIGYVLTILLWEQDFDFDTTDSATNYLIYIYNNIQSSIKTHLKYIRVTSFICTG